MIHSCGALLFSFDKYNNIGVILGSEDNNGFWFNFKGCNELGETFEETAIREVKEETCGLVLPSNIKLDHVFSTKTKTYHIGLLEVSYDIIEKFNIYHKTNICSCEKKELKFFKLKDIFDNFIHNTTRASIFYYWNHLFFNQFNNMECYCIDRLTAKRMKYEHIR